MNVEISMEVYEIISKTLKENSNKYQLISSRLDQIRMNSEKTRYWYKHGKMINIQFVIINDETHQKSLKVSLIIILIIREINKLFTMHK